jgi:carboxyl-terminal processing protease
MLASGRLFLMPAALAALPAVLLCGGDVQTSPPSSAARPVGLRLIRSVMRQVQHSYVAPINADTLVAGAIGGMLGSLDPHSEYLNDEEYEDMESDNRGEIEGVGLNVRLLDGTPFIVQAIEGGPAARAGIRPGDRLLALNGQSTIGLTADELLHQLRGAIGSTVTLTIARDRQADRAVTLSRAHVHLPSVTSAVVGDGIGYARIGAFTETTPTELFDAMARLRQSGALQGFVLDLRNDLGGLFASAVTVAADFLDGGTVVATHGRGGDNDVYSAPENGDLIRGVPMVVLINGYSASAAEIVAGALQDRHRATVLGTRSFGQGTIQTFFPLDGHGAVRLTTAIYLTPSARSIQGSGITPDVIVPLPPGERDADAVDEHAADLPHALPAAFSENEMPAAAAAPSASRLEDAPIDPAIIGTAADDQLQAALKLLQIRSAVDAAAPPP